MHPRRPVSKSVRPVARRRHGASHHSDRQGNSADRSTRDEPQVSFATGNVVGAIDDDNECEEDSLTGPHSVSAFATRVAVLDDHGDYVDTEVDDSETDDDIESRKDRRQSRVAVNDAERTKELVQVRYSANSSTMAPSDTSGPARVANISLPSGSSDKSGETRVTNRTADTLGDHGGKLKRASASSSLERGSIARRPLRRREFSKSELEFEPQKDDSLEGVDNHPPYYQWPKVATSSSLEIRETRKPEFRAKRIAADLVGRGQPQQMQLIQAQHQRQQGPQLQQQRANKASPKRPNSLEQIRSSSADVTPIKDLHELSPPTTFVSSDFTDNDGHDNDNDDGVDERIALESDNSDLEQHLHAFDDSDSIEGSDIKSRNPSSEPQELDQNKLVKRRLRHRRSKSTSTLHKHLLSSPSPSSNFGPQSSLSNSRRYFWNRKGSLSCSSVFALYAARYARERFLLALRAFKLWYHKNLTYHHLANRMEFNEQKFERWFESRGRPLSLRALDHYDRIVIWIADERDAILKRTFTNWINKCLGQKRQIRDLFQDLRDGQNLISLIENLSGQTLPRERGRMRVHQLQNIQIVLNYIKYRKVKLVNIRPEEIVDGNQKLTLALIWTIILHFQLEDSSDFRELDDRRAAAQKEAEAKLRLKLDAMRRELEELERRIDNMGPVAKDLATLQKQLAELHKFDQDLNKTRNNLNDLINFAEDLIGQDLIADPPALREELQCLKDHLARIEEKAARRLREFEDALRRAEAKKAAEKEIYLKLDGIKKELDELERRIDNMAPVGKDLATVQRQIEEMRQFGNDVARVKGKLNDIAHLAEDMIRDDLISDPVSLRAAVQECKDQMARIEDKMARRLRALKRAEAQKTAEQEIYFKLDGIKKELDELERRIDNMAPVGKDLATLQRQIEEMRQFETDVARVKGKLNDIVHLAENLIRDDLISDPVGLRSAIRDCKDQMARIEDKMARRLRALKDALRRAESQREAEAKFNLKLDAMKRELDEMERRLDNMAPVAKDLETLQKQLTEINDFIQALNQTRHNLNDLVKLGEDLIRDDMIADPANLRQKLKGLKDQFARIEDKAGKRLRDIQDAMSRVAASDAIQNVAKWLNRAKKILVEEENVHGDLDTVNALIEQHKSFQEELNAHQPAMNEIRRMEQDLSNSSPQNGALIKDELSALSNLWKEVEKLTREKTMKLDDALRAAEQMHGQVHKLLEWLADSEMRLRFNGPLPDDENIIKQELGEHEKFMRKLASQGSSKDQTLKLAREILSKCHLDAEPVIKHWINIIESRWEEIEAWAQQRGQRLADHLKSLKELLELVEELLGWLARHEGRLSAEETDSLPENVNQLESLIDQHSSFMDELRKREPDVDKVVKIFAAKSSTTTSKMILTTTTTKPRTEGSGIKASTSSGRLSGGARSTTPTSRTSYATYRDEYPEIKQSKAKLMVEKWRSVWQLSLDKMQRLKDRVEHLREVERLENFDFDEWRQRFLGWINSRRGRIMDFFRSIDEDNDGRIPIEQFIRGVMRSTFESSRVEMERVAEIFDKNNDGTIDNKEFLDSLRPDKPVTDEELIQDEVQRQVARCTCAQKYRVYHVGEGRYRFGESQKLRLVRILRSTVMVRVGGGWEPLNSFLQKNDPCRAKGRTNVELREQFILPEGASQAMAAFRSRITTKDPGSGPVLGPITKIREKTERSMPITGTSRYGSPSDYFSETESSSKARSRIGRLTPASASSRPASRSGSRLGSDLDASMNQQKSRSTDNL